MEGFRTQIELQTNTRLVICDSVLCIHSGRVFISLDSNGMCFQFVEIFEFDSGFARTGFFELICLFEYSTLFVFNLNPELVAPSPLIIANF